MDCHYLFAGEFAEFEHYIEQLDVVTDSYRKGEVIQPEEGKFLYVKKGWIKLLAENENGKSKIFAFIKDQTICPYLFGDRNSYVVIEAASKTEVYYLDESQLNLLGANNPEFMMRLIKQYTKMIQLQFHEAAHIVFDSTEQRIGWLLGELMNRDNEVSLSQEDMAALAGISKIQVVRAYKDLKEKHLIQVYKKRVKILDTELLHSYILNA